MSSLLFSEYKLGCLALTNRLVMAPMTRCRTINGTPNELMAKYYQQRSSAGLIIAEATAVSPNGMGYIRMPGIFSPEQVAGWKLVTQSVHASGSKIFVQLVHTGRVANYVNLPTGAQILAPSAVKVNGDIYTDAQGMQPMSMPVAMNDADIQKAIAEHVEAAKNAISAGFDGVELHAANGYLLEQFMRPNSNQRQDKYGGSIENRSRFLFEVVDAVVDAIGKDKVGIRLSPYGEFNDMLPYDSIESDYAYWAEQLNKRGIVYIHLLLQFHDNIIPHQSLKRTKQTFREKFHGTIILSGGYHNPELIENEFVSGTADLIAVGRPFIANPDLATRWKNNLSLNSQLDLNTFYTPGEKGYIDYPMHNNS